MAATVPALGLPSTERKATMKTTRKRRTLQPATGSSRWAVRPSLTGRPGRLVITFKLANGTEVTETYIVTENRQDGTLLGYRLTKRDGTAYDLLSCDCPAFTQNRTQAETAELRLCKHCRGLAAALAALEH
jgi:hypothetical protein